jgi:putative endonuclease
MHTVYILHSQKLNRFYTGYTTNLDVRMEFHANSETRKYTYNADDWTIFFTVNCESKSQALAIEKHIKAMKSKAYIKNLKKYPEIMEKLFEKYISSEY